MPAHHSVWVSILEVLPIFSMWLSSAFTLGSKGMETLLDVNRANGFAFGMSLVSPVFETILGSS